MATSTVPVKINRVHHSLPIRFNGLAIGTNELDREAAANGTILALAQGHHFRQRGWYLNVDGPQGGTASATRDSYHLDGGLGSSLKPLKLGLPGNRVNLSLSSIDSISSNILGAKFLLDIN